MNAVAVVVVVVFLAVARWGVPVVVGTVPRTEGFRKLFENVLTGLAVQSVVFGVGLQFVFVGNFAGFVPLLAGVVVGDVPQFGCRPPVPV